MLKSPGRAVKGKPGALAGGLRSRLAERLPGARGRLVAPALEEVADAAGLLPKHRRVRRRGDKLVVDLQEQGARGVSVVVTRVTVVFGFPSRHLALQIRHCAILWCGGYFGQQVCGISVSDERRKRQKHEGRSCYERVVKSRRDHAHRSIS